MTDDDLARCPSCGAWQAWPDIHDYLAAELDPTECHHPTQHHHTKENAA